MKPAKTTPSERVLSASDSEVRYTTRPASKPQASSTISTVLPWGASRSEIASDNPCGVEKLAHCDFAKTASRQEALLTIFPSLLDIFYHPIFDFFQKNRLFQQPPLLSTVI